MGRTAIRKKRDLRDQIGRNAMRSSMRSRKENANTARQGLYEAKCGKCSRIARVPGKADIHRGCGGRWR